MAENWEQEDVLAFVYDVRPWREFDDAERAEWCRRVKYVRDNVTTDGKAWTMSRLAGLFGLAQRGLQERFARSEGDKGYVASEANKLPRRARAEFNRAPVEVRAEIVAAAMDDAEVSAAVHKLREARRHDEFVMPMDPPALTARTRANSLMSDIDRDTATLASTVAEGGYSAAAREELEEWAADHIQDVQTKLTRTTGTTALKVVGNR